MTNRPQRTALAICLLGWTAGCGAAENPVGVRPTASVEPRQRRTCVAPESAFPSCTPRPPSSEDPTPWPRPSQLVDTRPWAIVPSLTKDRIAALADKDAALPKLDDGPRALLVAAEDAYAAALSDDAKWPAARAAYEAFVATPTPLESYGRFMIARVLAISEEPAALGAFAAITTGPLAAAARAELTRVAAKRGEVPDILATLRSITPDDASAAVALAEIATEASRVGELSRARQMAGALLTLDADADARCASTLARAAAQVELHPDPTTEAQALDELTGRTRAFRAGSAPETAKTKCDVETLEWLTRVSTRLHIQYIGARGHKGTGDPKVVHAAIDLYESILSNYTADDIERLSDTFPPRVRPSAFRVRHAIADLRYANFEEGAAAAYDELIELSPNAPDIQEMIYRAAVSRWRVRGETLDDVRLDGSAAMTEDAARSAADSRLLCLGEPPRSASDHETYVTALADRARLSLLSYRWGDAAADLRTLAFHHPGSKGATHAPVLYLETLSRLGKTAPEPCEAEIQSAAPSLFEMYCATRDRQHGDFGAGNPFDHAARCDLLRGFAPSLIPAAIHPDLPPLPALPVAPVGPSVRYDAASTSGELPIEVIESVAQPYLRRTVGCYEAALAVDPTIEGQIEVTFVIGRDGAVTSATSRASAALDGTRLGRCVVRAFYGISFPQPEGGMMRVTYPLGFSLTRGVIPPQPERPVSLELVEPTSP